MSWKSRLFYLSVIAFLIVNLTIETFAQDTEPAKTKPVVDEQGGKEEAAPEEATPRSSPEVDDVKDHSAMTLEEIPKDLTARFRAYTKRYRAAPTARQKREVTKTIPSANDYQDRLIELINEESGSQAGLDAIGWWIKRSGKSGKQAEIILDLAMKHYSKIETIDKYIVYFRWKLPPEQAEQDLRVLMDVNPSDAVKAYASFELHELLREQTEASDGKSVAPLLAEMKTLRDSVNTNYADAVDVNGLKLVDRLEAFEFAKKLKIGQPLPEIIGTDLKGDEFKLSDYDGNVRVVSFWGHW